jgi:hypothetical protein
LVNHHNFSFLSLYAQPACSKKQSSIISPASQILFQADLKD